MSIDIVFPVILVLVAAYFTLFRASWSTVGSNVNGSNVHGAAGRAERQPSSSTMQLPAPQPHETIASFVSVRGGAAIDKAATPARLVPSEGFITAERFALIDEAEMRLEGHIAYDRVQLRPGWLLFDPIDIMGHPPVVIRFTPDVHSGREPEVHLYPIEDIRRVEREHSYLAQCRRASVQARWDERRAARQRSTAVAA